MKLSEAYLCEDCQQITGGSRRCEVCASSAVYPLQKLLERRRIPKVRAKVRPGRLRGNALKELRAECWVRDLGRCVECEQMVSSDGCSLLFPPMHMAHIKSRGAGGKDELSNVRTLCPTCHLVGEHNPKSVPAKERVA